MSSSVAQNNGTSMYRKCSGKSASIYCCIRFHPSQCVSPMDRRLIQILLIIGGVEQNPGPGTNSPERRDELSPKRSAAKDAPKCSPKAKRKERILTKSTTKKEYKLSRKIADGINYLLNGQESSINSTDDQPYCPEDLSRMPYTYDYDDEEFEQYGTEPVPITQMPIQNIPSTNTNAQQYSNESMLLTKINQLEYELTNCRQIIASHQLLPPKATPHVSYLQCSHTREFGLYHLIHYFSIKISKDKQARAIDFTTFAPLSNISALNMLDTVLRSASHIFQPAVIINS